MNMIRSRGRIFFRGKTWWLSYYVHGKEYRRSAKTADREEAQRLLDAIPSDGIADCIHRKRRRQREKTHLVLGQPIGTAAHRLRKMIIFDMCKKLSLDMCYRCHLRIEKIEELSIDHKKPYLNGDDPLRLFWDINNIAFSHSKCNSAAARRPPKLKTTPSSAIMNQDS